MADLGHDPTRVAAGGEREARERAAERVRRDALGEQAAAFVCALGVRALDRLGEEAVADVARVEVAALACAEDGAVGVCRAAESGHRGEVHAQLVEQEDGQLDVAVAGLGLRREPDSAAVDVEVAEQDAGRLGDARSGETERREEGAAAVSLVRR